MGSPTNEQYILEFLLETINPMYTETLYKEHEEKHYKWLKNKKKNKKIIY